MERWYEIYADVWGHLIVEGHDSGEKRLKRTVLDPIPFWRMLAVHGHALKVRLVLL